MIAKNGVHKLTNIRSFISLPCLALTGPALCWRSSISPQEEVEEEEAKCEALEEQLVWRMWGWWDLGRRGGCTGHVLEATTSWLL